MGTRMAPSYANLFMAKLEQEFLLTQNNKPRVWWRFIHGIFAIWTHGEVILNTFIESLNRHHSTIKFTATWSTESVTILDTTVYIKENGLIGTDLYVKPTDKPQYLRMDSCHLRHCKASISFSQALRLRRICSDDCTYLNRTREFKQYFLSQGYNEQHLEKEFNRAFDITREASLQSKLNQEKPACRVAILAVRLSSCPLAPSAGTMPAHISMTRFSETPVTGSLKPQDLHSCHTGLTHNRLNTRPAT